MIKIGTIKVLGSALYQWELGRKVQIFLAPDMRVAAVQFAHMGDAEALNVEPREENGIIVADIPNILLQSGQKIAVFLVDVNENKVETTTHTILPVIPRPRPTDYVYTETEVLSWQALEARVIAFMEEMNEAREAGDFNGDSAYEIAVKYGYKGTEEEWIADLYGKAEQARAGAEEAQNKAEEAQQNAEQSANNAAESARKAELSKEGIEQAETNAANSADKALEAEQKAEKANERASNLIRTLDDLYSSALNLSGKAEESATKAAQSEAEAKKAAEDAKGSETNAGNSAASAAQYASDAEITAKSSRAYQENSYEYSENSRLYAQNAHNCHERSVELATKAEESANKASKSAEEAKQAAEEAKNASGGSGSGIEVTAKPGQLIRVKETDENGKPTAWEAVPWGYTEGGMVEILPETAFASADHPTFGLMWMYYKALDLKVGESYTVTYNGTPYECVCQTAPSGLVNDPNAVAMGNFSVVGGTNTGEPFALLFSPENIEIAVLDLTGSTSTPTIGIHGKTEIHHPIPGELLPEGVPYTEGVRVEVLAERTITIPNSGMYDIEEALNLTIGKTYIVNWNGVEYLCVAQDLSALTEGACGLGNYVIAGLPDTGEPFMISSVNNGTSIMGFDIPGHGATPVSISIYQDNTVTYPIPGELLPEGVPYVEKGGMVEILPETTIPIEGGEGFISSDALPLVVGLTYVVTWDGVEYTYVAEDASAMFPGAIMIGGFDQADPGAIAAVSGMGTMVSVNTDAKSETTISIKGESVKVNKIDPRCLPDGVGGTKLYNVYFTLSAAGGWQASTTQTFAEIYAKASDPNTIVRAVCDFLGSGTIIIPITLWTDSEVLFEYIQSRGENPVAYNILVSSDDVVSMDVKTL